MCGIVGFTWEDKELLQDMVCVISYRGPDDHGFYTDTNLSLGHRRLSIIDLSKAGNQPMTNNEASIVIVFNGEIYNFLELRKELENKYKFNSDTDTEVLIRGYEEWGPEGLLKRLNGMFSFAIWDTEKKQLFLARDRLGIKPLYYAQTESGFIFASEVKCLLKCPEIKKTLDTSAINSYMTYRFIPSDNTVLQGIKKLLPGHFLTFNTETGLTIRRYWDLEFSDSSHNSSHNEQQAVKHFKDLLNDCVEKRLMSDVPLGAYLSGGLDSSLIVAANAKLREDPVKTFTVGFGHATDEFKQAATVAEHLGTDHHELILDYEKMTKELPKIVWYMDEPNSDITMVPLYFLSQFSRKKVTVVNTGEGADELFSGYPHFRVGSPSFRLIPKIIKKNAYSLYYSPFKSWERKQLFNTENAAQPKEDNTLNQFLHAREPKDMLNRILRFDIKNELPNWQLARVDRMTMAHSQEARVPFLDHRMVEFSASLPVKLKLKHLDGKYIVKKAAAGMIPKEIINRKKQGFTTPRTEWIKKDLHNVAFDLLSKDNVRERGIFNHNYIEKLINKVRSSDDKPFRPYSYKLMMLAMFEMWSRIYIDNKKPI